LVTARGNIPPPNAEEKEILEVLAPGNNQVRLACQITVTSDLEIFPFI
jgi:ferredoxin